MRNAGTMAWLMPKPKRVVGGEGQCIVSRSLPIQKRGPVGAVAVADLKAALQRFGDPAVLERRKAVPTIVLESGASDAPRKPEGYRLEVAARHVRIAGRDTAGVFFGVQTLCQILSRVGSRLPCGIVEDWPDFPIRAAHLTLFRYQNQRPNLAFWEHLLTTVAPTAKLNAAIIQTDWMLRYRRHPEMAQPGALTLAQMQRLVRLGRERHIAVIPHLQCLSHQFSLVGYAHPEWLSGKDSETYNPDAPGLRAALRDLMTDLRTAFGDLPPGSPVGNGAPPLHIGLDEVGRLPTRDGENEATCFLRHLRDLDTDARGAGFASVGFWPDMLPRYDRAGQGRNLLARVPAGTLVFPWNYDNRADFPLLDPFQATPLPVWATGSAKYHRDNLGRLARAARRCGCVALVGSCWNSWDARFSDGVAKPLSSLLLAGEFGWTADADAPPQAPLRELPYDPVLKLRELTKGIPPVL